MGNRHEYRVLGWQEAEQIAERMAKVGPHNRIAMVAPYAKRHKTSQAEIKRVCKEHGVQL